MEETVDKTIYNSFEQELVDSGYKIFKSGFSRAIRGFQKRFDDDKGTKFFITVWHWNNGKQFQRDDISYIDSYQFTTQFILSKRVKELIVDIGISAKVLPDEYDGEISTLSEIEEFFNKTWNDMGCPYYES